jgi:hypothetical protein
MWETDAMWQSISWKKSFGEERSLLLETMGVQWFRLEVNPYLVGLRSGNL